MEPHCCNQCKTHRNNQSAIKALLYWATRGPCYKCSSSSSRTRLALESCWLNSSNFCWRGVFSVSVSIISSRIFPVNNNHSLLINLMNVLISQFITDHQGLINLSFFFYFILYTADWSCLMCIKLDKDINCILPSCRIFFPHYCSLYKAILVFGGILYRHFQSL